MTIAARLRKYLEGQGASYDLIPHPRTTASSRTAQAAHVPGRLLAKSVVVHHELGYALAVVPSSHRVELDTLQGVLGKRLGLAAEDEIARLFDDCDLGAVPPIGAAYGVPVVVEESLADAPDVYFEGGDHATLVHVAGDAFRKLMKEARAANFSHPA
jgi:Ala-tRNA(Pro) deacylase